MFAAAMGLLALGALVFSIGMKAARNGDGEYERGATRESHAVKRGRVDSGRLQTIYPIGTNHGRKK